MLSQKTALFDFGKCQYKGMVVNGNIEYHSNDFCVETETKYVLK